MGTPAHTDTVVTWQSDGPKIDICTACQERLEAAGVWPKDHRGVEFARASHGRHHGVCDYHGQDVLAEVQ